jgi:beta-lactamase superfamily II metal-dependent hydrolase
MSGDTISIRMYNVGFGDSFLLRFPCTGGERTMLIDCGFHPAGPGPYSIDKVVDQIIADVTKGNKAHIDVVVATHRHRDHVLGFENEKWKSVSVGEVWMPWTEDPKNPDARKIRETQSKKASALCMAMRAAHVPSRVLEIAENALTNAKAMATLHNGFAGKPVRRFLPSSKRPDATFTTDTLPGLIIHAMGPSHDPKVIRDMNPPKGESFLQLSGKAGGNGTPIVLPFDARFKVRQSEAEKWLKEAGISPRQLKTIETMAQEDPLALAVALDAAVNGTSLMLMFEMGKAFLLFPGDAQWGTWQNALTDPEWRDLLEKTNFYKVGHHGSHNATPREFVDKVLGTKFSGMVCTDTTKKFPLIPRIPLMHALNKKCGNHIARSDDGVPVKGFTRNDDVSTDTKVSV